VQTPTVTPRTVAAATLPVHPRRAGWRAGAAAALVDAAVADLHAGRSPAATVLALADLGGYDRPRGLAGAEELDRRLAVALSGVRALAAAGADTDALNADALAADDVVGALLDTLPAAAVVGCPHPGEWVASSVDVVPCAVHGYEAGPVDCMRRSVRSYLIDAARLDGHGALPGGAGTLVEQVRAAAPTAAAPRLCREQADDPTDDPELVYDVVLATLWLGVVTVAAVATWRAYAAAR